MKYLTAIACLCLALPCAAAADAKAEQKARIARYYAADLEPALLAVRIGIMIVSQCADRFASECTDGQKGAAADKASKFAILDLLTLFPTRVDLKFDDPDRTYAQMRETLSAMTDEVLKLAANWDLLLFARYGATLRACPPPDAADWRRDVAIFQGAEFTHFRLLSDREREDEIARMVIEELRLRDVIKKEWTPDECTAAQETGVKLLEHLYGKLQPWMANGTYPEGRDVRRDATIVFLQSAAIELETLVNPGVREQLKALRKR
jgi:hypothetical protein